MISSQLGEHSEEKQTGFIERFLRAYVEETEAGPELPRRGLLAPFNSPPFPSSEYLGIPLIGAPDTTAQYPLMRAMAGTSVGEALKAARVNVYGWINPSANFSTSKNSNIPLAYGVIPNNVVLDQAVIRVERVPDTVQTDHVDWGFRSSTFYGIDYRYTTAKGWFSDQLFKHNQIYGFDPIELYGQLYIPWIAEGMVLKIGRYISLPDIEAQLAPDNYLFSHSLMFSYDPFTMTGVVATVRLREQWTVQLGVHAGNDMAPWTNSSQPNGQAMVRWVSKDNNDSIYAGLNMIGTGKYKNGHDNLQQVVGTWAHKFTEDVYMQTEAYYEWQYDAAKGGSCIDGPSNHVAFGGGCGPTIPGLSAAVGAVNYFMVALSKKDYTTIRNDYLHDMQGQRTGFKTVYSSHTLGWAHWFSNELLMRPELRYDHSWSHATPYDLGTRRDQFTAATDLIFRF